MPAASRSSRECCRPGARVRTFALECDSCRYIGCAVDACTGVELAAVTVLERLWPRDTLAPALVTGVGGVESSDASS